MEGILGRGLVSFENSVLMAMRRRASWVLGIRILAKDRSSKRHDSGSEVAVIVIAVLIYSCSIFNTTLRNFVMNLSSMLLRNSTYITLCATSLLMYTGEQMEDLYALPRIHAEAKGK